MTRHQALIAALTLLVAAGSAAVLLTREPERLRAASSDGRLKIEGVGSASADWRIVRRDDLQGPFTAAVPPVYDLGDGVAAPRPFELTLAVSDASGPVDRPTLANFDAALSAWRLVPSVFDAAAGTLTAQLTRAEGLWAAAVRPSVAAPEAALAMRNELLAFPPEGAVGYRLSVLFSQVPGDFVLLEETLERGGCGGVYRSGTSRTQTSADRRVGDLTYRLLARWEQNGGCRADEPLRTAKP